MRLTTAGKDLLSVLMHGALERPRGFAEGAHGWDLCLDALVRHGLATRCVMEDGAVYGVITPKGAELGPNLIVKRPPGRPPVGSITYGALTPTQKAMVDASRRAVRDWDDVGAQPHTTSEPNPHDPE